ncbi:hypothetical protein HU200_048032 [Digitaria exilis]|uniref:Uncharacterized protein n=1 Tax=Digitaria exilis TaxID=1010633 RepID=A0A835E818_9POAL|nr:hypothetical protein HU200_048032 [Digitaria exilis]
MRARRARDRKAACAITRVHEHPPAAAPALFSLRASLVSFPYLRSSLAHVRTLHHITMPTLVTMKIVLLLLVVAIAVSPSLVPALVAEVAPMVGSGGGRSSTDERQAGACRGAPSRYVNYHTLDTGVCGDVDVRPRIPLWLERTGVVLACDMAAELEPGGPPGDVLACAAATSLSPHRARSKVMESKWPHLHDLEEWAHPASPAFLFLSSRGPPLLSSLRSPTAQLGQPTTAQPNTAASPASSPAQLRAPSLSESLTSRAARAPSFSLRLTTWAHSSAPPPTSRRGQAGLRAAVEFASARLGAHAKGNLHRPYITAIPNPSRHPSSQRRETLAEPPPSSRARLAAALPPSACPGASPCGKEYAKPFFPSSFALQRSRKLAGAADPPLLAAGHHSGLNLSSDPQNRTHVVSSTSRAKRGEKPSSLAPSRANSGESPAARRREPPCSGEPSLDLISAVRFETDGSDLNRVWFTVNPTVDRDVSPRQQPAAAAPVLQKSPCIVVEPFEFTDDPVSEEQVQRQFTEEGKYNTDHPCYLYTD